MSKPLHQDLSQFLFSEVQFEKLRQLLVQLTGNTLTGDKRPLVDARLRRHLIEKNVTAGEYLALVEKDPVERDFFISALTTHKTDWFRESVHLDFLKALVAGAPQRTNPDTPWQIWSAACSTGEECFSIAMTLLEMGLRPDNYRILGTDISRHCLEAASQGIFDRTRVDEQVPLALKAKYFMRGIGPKSRDHYKISPVLTENLKWRQFNLINGELPTPIKFDVIFLRNTLIYFTPETTAEVARRMMEYLVPGGHLIIGLSESITGVDRLGLTRVDNSVYRK